MSPRGEGGEYTILKFNETYNRIRIAKTGHFYFLGTKTMNCTKQVLDEFDTNLELLKIAYKIYHMELTRDTIIYSCSLEN
jgi:hypothetical protein